MHAVDDPIDVLVATDVLSEGQNLQDSHIIVNTTCPGPSSGSSNARVVSTVSARSPTPSTLPDHPREDRATDPTAPAHQGPSRRAAEAFGSGREVLGGDREIKILDDFYKGRVTDDDTDDEAEADSVSEAWLVWSSAQDQFPVIAGRSCGCRTWSTPPATSASTSTVASPCYVATASGVDAFATSDSTGERILTPLEALRVFRADPDTPTARYAPTTSGARRPSCKARSGPNHRRRQPQRHP